MKRFSTILLAGLFVLVCAGSAFASDVTISGVYRAQMWYIDSMAEQIDTKLGNPAGTTVIEDKDDPLTGVTQRLRLSFDAKVTDEVSAFFNADIDEGFWNTASSDRSAWHVNQVYLKAKVAKTPIWIQVGKQDVTWGSGILVKNDYRDRVKVWGAFGPVTAGVAYDKMVEGLKTANVGGVADDDYNGYALYAVGKVAGWSLGGFLYANDNQSFSGSTQNDSNVTAIDFIGNGPAGPVALGFEVAALTGTKSTRKFAEATGWSSWSDVDASGMGAIVTAAIPVGPASLSAAIVYASGDDASTTDEDEAFFFDYDSAFANVVLYNADNFYFVNGLTGGSGDNGFTNGFGAKIGAGVKAGPVDLGAAVIYAVANEESATGDEIGIEADLTAAYMINEKVTFSAALGYLEPGDYFGKDLDPITVAMAKFQIAF
jgi:hypothetical protein